MTDTQLFCPALWAQAWAEAYKEGAKEIALKSEWANQVLREEPEEHGADETTVPR